MGGWMICCHKSITRKKKERKKSTKKRKEEKNDLVCEQYTNVCKLGASWDRQDFKNHVN
jgi:hypothetical protein